ESEGESDGSENRVAHDASPRGEPSVLLTGAFPCCSAHVAAQHVRHPPTSVNSPVDIPRLARTSSQSYAAITLKNKEMTTPRAAKIDRVGWSEAPTRRFVRGSPEAAVR